MFNITINSFGLDISELSLKAAQLRKVNNGLYLQAWNNLQIPEGVIQGGNIADEKKFINILAKLVETTTGNITTDYVIMCLPETRTFIKLLTIDYAKKNIETALEEELSRHIPMTLSELNYDWQLLSDDTLKKRAKILVGAAPSKLIDSYILAVKKVGLKPVALEIEAQSIVNSLFAYPQDCYSKQQSTFRFLRKKDDNLKSLEKNKENKSRLNAKHITNYAKIIIDLGASRSSLILYDHDTIQFTSSSNISGQQISKTIAEKLKLDLKEAEKAKILCGLDTKKAKGKLRQTIYLALTALIGEINKMTTFYDNHFEAPSPINQIVLTGGGANMIGLADCLAEKTQVNVIKGYPLGNHFINNKEKPIPENQILTFNTALGLALRNIIVND